MRPLLRWPTRLFAYGLFCLLDHSIWLLIQLLPGPTLIGLARRRPWTRWQLQLAPARQQLWRSRLAWLMRTRCRRAGWASTSARCPMPGSVIRSPAGFTPLG